MNRSTVFASVIFIGLAVFAVMSLNDKSERGITRISLSDIDLKRIDHIEITGEEPITLDKKDDLWRLSSGRPADPSAVEGLLTGLMRVQSDEMVTRDGERYGELKVDDAGGVRVTVSARGNELANFVVGDAVPGGAYVRLGDDVYRVDQFNRAAFVRDRVNWQKRTLFDDSLDHVAKVEVALNGKAPYTLVKKDAGYVLDDPSILPEGFRFDSNSAHKLVSSLLKIRVREILDTDPGVETTGLGANADVLRYLVAHDQKGSEAAAPKGPNGKGGADGPAGVRALKLGKARDPSTYYGQIEGSKDVVLVQAATARTLRKEPTDMRDLSMMKFDATKASKLSIKAGAVDLVLAKKGNAWKLQKSKRKPTPDFVLDSRHVSQRISALAGAHAMALATGVSASAAGVAGDGPHVNVTVSDGKNARLQLGKALKHEGQDSFYAKGNVDDNVYIITKQMYDTLTGDLNGFNEQAGAGPGTGAVGGRGTNLDPESLAKLPPEIRRNMREQESRKKKEDAIFKAFQEQMRSGGGGSAPSK